MSTDVCLVSTLCCLTAHSFAQHTLERAADRQHNLTSTSKHEHFQLKVADKIQSWIQQDSQYHACTWHRQGGYDSGRALNPACKPSQGTEPQHVLSAKKQRCSASRPAHEFSRRRGLTDLAAPVQGQDLGPDEDQGLAQVRGCGLQQLEDVWEDADREGQVHSPAAHVQEAPQQHQGSQPVHLTQQHLHAELSTCGQQQKPWQDGIVAGE